jgi:hypothetical protein
MDMALMAIPTGMDHYQSASASLENLNRFDLSLEAEMEVAMIHAMLAQAWTGFTPLEKATITGDKPKLDWSPQ